MKADATQVSPTTPIGDLTNAITDAQKLYVHEASRRAKFQASFTTWSALLTGFLGFLAAVLPDLLDGTNPFLLLTGEPSAQTFARIAVLVGWLVALALLVFVGVLTIRRARQLTRLEITLTSMKPIDSLRDHDSSAVTPSSQPPTVGDRPESRSSTL